MTNKAETFFAAYHWYEVEQSRRTARRIVWATVSILLLVTLSLVGLLWVVSFRPAAIVEYCGVSEEKVPSTPAHPTILLFLDHFVTRYSSQRPDAAIAIAEAYSMMTPRLQQVLLAERADIDRIGKWMNQNIQSDFSREKVRVTAGDDGRITIQALGTFIFRPAVGFDGDHHAYKNSVLYAFIQAALLPVPVTETTPYGLLVDFYRIQFFDDADARKAFLLKRGITFSEIGDG